MYKIPYRRALGRVRRASKGIFNIAYKYLTRFGDLFPKNGLIEPF